MKRDVYINKKDFCGLLYEVCIPFRDSSLKNVDLSRDSI